MILELLQQPLLEGVGIIYRQSGHQIKGALGTFTDHAGNLLELADHRVTAALILLTNGGEILRDGQPIRKLGKSYRACLGFMPQQQELYANMTARDFLGYLSALKGIPRKEAKDQIADVLEQVELSEQAAQKIGGFSGGMKQRLLIAQALLGNPSLLILDEPTAGLDPKQRVIIRNLTDRLGQEKIILISTHIISDIETIADQILLLRKGTLLTHGTVSELIEQVQTGEKTLENLYLQYYGGEANAAGGA